MGPGHLADICPPRQRHVCFESSFLECYVASPGAASKPAHPDAGLTRASTSAALSRASPPPAAHADGGRVAGLFIVGFDELECAQHGNQPSEVGYKLRVKTEPRPQTRPYPGAAPLRVHSSAALLLRATVPGCARWGVFLMELITFIRFFAPRTVGFRSAGERNPRFPPDAPRPHRRASTRFPRAPQTRHICACTGACSFNGAWVYNSSKRPNIVQ